MEGISTAAGTQTVVMGMPHWPPAENALIREMQLSDGRVLLGATRSGQLQVELIDDAPDGPRLLSLAQSCPLRSEGEALFVAVVTWKDRTITGIYVNGSTCFRRGSTEGVAKETDITKRSTPDFTDFTERNRQAKLNRESKLGGIHPKPKRSHGGPDFAFQALRDELHQITDLLEQIENGKEHHVRGLASRVRLLVADTPIGLLQRAAGYAKQPLILYTAPNPEAVPPLSPALDLSFIGSPEPRALWTNPVDLDVWLDLPTMGLNGKSYSNLNVIKEIGNTLGSHLDIDITDAIRALMGRPPLRGAKYNNITAYVVLSAKIVAGLAAKVLQSAGQPL